MTKSFLLLCAFICLSCKNDSDKISNIDDNGIRFRYYNLQNAGWKSKLHTQHIDDMNFTATEIPIVYYILKDQGSANLTAVDSIYEENKRERIFEFAFEQQDEKDVLGKDFTGMSYEESVKYMSFGLEKDFYAVTSKNDTIPCSGVHFERSFKITPYQKVMLFFSGIDPDEKLQLVYKDYLYRKGTLKFKFQETYIKTAS